MSNLYLLLFSILCIGLLYVCYLLLKKPKQKINKSQLILYVTTVAFIGVFGEVFVGSLYHAVVGTPLWRYELLPIHNAYTSYYSLVIWGMYGFYLYLFHNYTQRPKRAAKRYRYLVIGAEALLLEVAINLLFIAIFGQYVFYYLPNDLWHLTSVQAAPFYVLVGIVIAKSLRHFKSDIKFFSLENACLAFVLIFLVGARH